MLLSWLSKLLASLLVSILFVTTFGLVASQTILKSHYIEDQLQKNNAYGKLASSISDQIVKNADATLSKSQLSDQVKAIVTPEVVQQKLTTTLDQLQAYYTGSGPAPTLDVSDLVAKAQAAGVPAPADSNLTKPITIAGTAKAKDVKAKVGQVKSLTIVLIAVLVIGLTAIAIVRHTYVPLANVLVSLGGMLTLSGAGLMFAPSLADKLIKFDYSSNAFAGIAHDLIKSIGQDIGKRLLIIGATVLAVGILTRIVLSRVTKPRQPLTEPASETQTSESEAPQDTPLTVDEPKPTKPEPPKIQL